MSAWLDIKYLNLLSPHLRNFKRKSQNLFNFACPYCGDSKRDKRKARGYAYEASGTFLYTCHNCGVTTNIPKLVKHVSPVLYDEYLKDSLVETIKPSREQKFAAQVNKPVTFDVCPLRRLKKVAELHCWHPARTLLDDRKIPPEWLERLYYCPRFKEFTNSLLPEPKFTKESLEREESRIIIPFLTKTGDLYGYQGRAIVPVDPQYRYLSIILDDNHPKLFGLEWLDQDRKFYVFEGPFDSMFVPNSCAATGSDLLQVVGHLNRDNAILIFDNEPFSAIICSKIQKAINLGFMVVIWPSNITAKDVNDMILDGMSADLIKSTIDTCIFSGLEAQLEFNNWKRCNK